MGTRGVGYIFVEGIDRIVLYSSTEFNGDMDLECYGYEFLDRLSRVQNTTDFVKEMREFKEMKFDISQKKVTINNESLDISGKSYDILEYLVRNKDIIITKEQLFNRIWGFESETIWSVVEVYVSNIRKVLKKYDYHIYLKTLRNVGYMWSEKE